MASNELSKFRTIWYMGIPLYTTPCNCQRGRNELSKFRAIWYMGIPYIPHHVIVKEEDLYDPKLRNIEHRYNVILIDWKIHKKEFHFLFIYFSLRNIFCNDLLLHFKAQPSNLLENVMGIIQRAFKLKISIYFHLFFIYFYENTNSI